MLWLQTSLCFCCWIGYGVWLARSKSAKPFLAFEAKGLMVGPALFVLGVLVMTGALFAVGSFGGLAEGSLTPGAVFLVLIAGVVFVHAQCLGAVLILKSALRPETRPSRQTSDRKEDPS